MYVYPCLFWNIVVSDTTSEGDYKPQKLEVLQQKWFDDLQTNRHTMDDIETAETDKQNELFQEFMATQGYTRDITENPFKKPTTYF